MERDSESEQRPVVIVLNRDLFFGVKIADAARTLGYRTTFVKDAGQLASQIDAAACVLGIIDISAVDDWEVIGLAARGSAAPVLAFGPHTDVAGMRAAKSAGAVRTIANGEFHRRTADLISRYASPSVARNDTSALGEEIDLP
jgi:hypothetical protein